MKKVIGKIIEFAGDVKTGIRIYLLARRYSDRNRGISTSVLKSIYGKD